MKPRNVPSNVLPVLMAILCLGPAWKSYASGGGEAAPAKPAETTSSLPPVMGYLISPGSESLEESLGENLGASPEMRPGYYRPPLATSPELSRRYFESAKKLFGVKRFGESLAAFQAAVAERQQYYAQALVAVESFASLKENTRAKDSISALIDLNADKTLMGYHKTELEAKAGASLALKASLLLKEDPSPGFAGFLRAFLLVVDKRPVAELKDSIAALRQACIDLASYPEAEYWMARIYATEGELKLAEFQYRRAWDLRAGLDIPAEGVVYLGELADIFLTQKNYRAYEDILGTIASEDPLYKESRRYYRDGMERSLGREGFDRFFGLYRVTWGPWTRYELALGAFYLERGRPQALTYLAGAVNALLTRALWGIHEKDAAWEFSTLPAFLDTIIADRDLLAWAQSEGLFEGLYRLGLALDSGGYRESAREIWTVLAARPRLDSWSKASSRALASAKVRK